MQAAVVLNGKVVFLRSYGVANLQTPVPVTSETLFSINSITKAFVGIAVMEEVEKGRLDLSVPISTYLTDIPASWGKVTTRELLGQISGLPDIMAYGDSELIGLTDEKAAWAWALSQPVSPPGQKEDYCQTNLRLVQLIINKLNGRDPNASLIDQELAKAGMRSTSYGDSRDVIKGKSQPYRFADDGVIQNHFELFGPMEHADSGLNTTADDMALWMISILDGRQISERSREMMWTSVPLNDGSLSSFSLGWAPQHRANYSSVGMFGGARSAFSLFPQYNIGVVILTNIIGANPEELTDEVAASFVPEIRLSGVLKLRADEERSSFANLGSVLADEEAQHRSDDFNELELESWIHRLLWSKKPERALALSKFDRALFPASSTALELLAQSYEANKQPEEARRIHADLKPRNPNK